MDKSCFFNAHKLYRSRLNCKRSICVDLYARRASAVWGEWCFSFLLICLSQTPSNNQGTANQEDAAWQKGERHLPQKPIVWINRQISACSCFFFIGQKYHNFTFQVEGDSALMLVPISTLTFIAMLMYADGESFANTISLIFVSLLFFWYNTTKKRS